MPPRMATPSDDRIDTPVPAEDSANGTDRTIAIAPDGDVVLCVAHEIGASTQSVRFRVDSSLAASKSKYFAGLLGGRFGESERISKEHERLKAIYKTLGQVPSDELPAIHIEDIGRISTVKSIEPLCTDFLLLLHGKDLQSTPPVTNLANLAIVADRFDALGTTRIYAQRKKWLRSIDAKTTPKIDNGLSEEKVRQRVLVALLLDYGPWLDKYSARLVTKGWTGREPDDSAALWWDLPSRLEEELALRRESVLDTLQSLQAYFIGLYTSRERQCRLGYDSSAQCDSFQLGEMIRFFVRIGTLAMEGRIVNTTDELQPFGGDVAALIEAMRQVPEYQIDRNHSHCGIRTKLIPLLSFLEDALQHVGICADCWSTRRVENAWMDSKRPLIWRKQTFRWQNPACKEAHSSVRALFTAGERDWSP